MKPTYRKIIPRFVCAVLFTAAAVWPARADYSNTVASFNPIAYWRLNETAASPALNVLTNYGSVGAAGNGVVVRQVTKGQAGKVGNSILLYNGGSGSLACYSKVDVPFNAALNPPAPFSIEFWAYPTRSDQTLCALSSMNCQFNGGGSRNGWLFYENGAANWQFRIGSSSGYLITSQCASSVAPVVGAWQHIVGTYDGTTAKIYVNGVLSKSTTVPAGFTPNTQMPLMFGCLPLDGAGADTVDNPACSFGGIAGYRGFDGYLDEVAIYTNLLSASTVAAHYSAATTNNAGYGAQILADGPVGYWNCDELAVTAPAATTLPIAVDSGTLGSAVNGTNSWGDLAAQSGPPYAGMGGAANKACFFDGDNGYIGLLDNPGMHFSGQITMMAWVKPISVNYFRNIIGHGWDDQYRETFLRLSQGDDGTGGGDGNNYYEAGISLDGSEDGYDTNVTRYPIPAGDVGNWVFLAATYDGSAWNLYRNGRLVSQTVTPNGAVDVTNRWSIGSRSGPSPTVGFNYATFESEGLFFNGYIDEPAIFASALSALNISNIYNTALVPPVITRAPQNPGTVFKGSTVSFNVWAEGSPTLGWMWTSNGVPTGVTATNYTISNIPVGTYTIGVIVTNAYGTNSPSVTFSAVAAPPTITTQIGPETRFVGYPFSFTVGAGGSAPLTYYWYLGSTLMQSGASATYSGTASLLNAGNISVVVSNETTLTATSGPVLLTVNSVPSGYGGAVIGSGPIAYWRLDETSGTVAHDGIAGNDGTYNSTTLGVPGYSIIDSDKAVSFAGVNSYVGNISGTAINFAGHNNFTLEAWVNAPAGQNDEATIIAKGIGSVNTTRTEQFALDVASGVYRFFTTSGNTLFQVNASSGPNGSWQHVVGVYDDAGGYMYIYVNGVQEGYAKTRAEGLNGTTSAVSIGSKRTGNDPNYDGTFAGTVDEVAVYAKALDASTIQAHYSAAYGSSLAPFISVQPSPTTNYAGLPVTLTVVAAGSQPLSYQWKRNNVDLTSDTATTSALVISPVSSADAGTYKVGITNSVRGLESISVPLVVLAPPSSPPAIPGLVLHLPFDRNLTDTTGRGNNGVSIHTTTNVDGGGYSSNVVAATYNAGVLGQAFHYSTEATNTGGTSSVGTNDYYATLGVRPDLQFGSNVSFSVAYWIKLDRGYQGGDLPFFTDAKGSMHNVGFVFGPAYGYGTADSNPTPDPIGWAGCWGFTIYGNNTNGVAGVGVYGSNLGAYPGSINDGNWHHLVHVFDREANTTVTYLDGAPNRGMTEAGTTLAAAGNINSGYAATIGQDPTGHYGEAGSADIDDLGVWRKALTQLEAGSIYIAAISNNLSFAYVDISKPLTIQLIPSSQVKLTWAFGTLQAAGNVQGTYTNVTSVSPYTNSTAAGRMFYRVMY